MKYLKLYESFNEEDIHAICKRYNIKNYTINNGVVDVDGFLDLFDKDLTELPLKFGVVTGDFSCDYNKLTSLIGCPTYVGGSFYCHENMITSLEGCPTHIEHTFFCFKNNLTSLEGGPTKVGGDFNCRNNLLTSLEGGPKYVGGSYVCYNNDLFTLKGYPSELVGGIDYYPSPVTTIIAYFHDIEEYIDSLDYNYFRGGNKINKIRFTQALAEFGLECPDKIRGYVWE